MLNHPAVLEVYRAGTPVRTLWPTLWSHQGTPRCCSQTLMRVPAQLVEPRKVRLCRIFLVRTWTVCTAVCLQPFGNDRPNFGREVKTDLLIVINPIDTLVFSHNNSGRTTYVRRFVACHTFLPAEPVQPVQRCAS